MIDIELARKFVMQYVPAQGQVEVNDVWNFMKANPTQMLRNGLMFTQMEKIKSSRPDISSAACSGFVTGFALAYCMQSAEFCKNVAEAVEHGDRVKGENVVSFISRKNK